MVPSPLLLASVLKPVDDTRMFGKFGRTLAGRPDLQVHVVGRRAPRPPDAPANLHTHELLAGSRLSLGRLTAQWRYWRLLQKIRPALVIVHAPELLPLTLLWRSLSQNRHFLYDVRENYGLNILTQQVYPKLVRRALAGLVRRVETAAARRAAKLVLAERSYADELPFATPARTVILENKYQPLPHEVLPTVARPLPTSAEPLHLLYSGTISELNGVFDALAFVRRLRAVWPGAQLTIIGFCQRPEQLQRLRTALAETPDAVQLIGGDQLVPHADIVAAIRRSHVGLLPYQPHPSTWRCLPTKLFEYLAHGLPVIIPANEAWQPLVAQYQAGLVCADFAAPPAVGLAARLSGASFYPQGIPTDVLWPAEAPKLWQLIDSIR